MNKVEEVREHLASEEVAGAVRQLNDTLVWNDLCGFVYKPKLLRLLAAVSAYEVLTGVSLLPSEDELTAEVRRIVTRIQKVADAEPMEVPSGH